MESKQTSEAGIFLNSRRFQNTPVVSIDTGICWIPIASLDIQFKLLHTNRDLWQACIRRRLNNTVMNCNELLRAFVWAFAVTYKQIQVVPNAGIYFIVPLYCSHKESWFKRIKMSSTSYFFHGNVFQDSVFQNEKISRIVVTRRYLACDNSTPKMWNHFGE